MCSTPCRRRIRGSFALFEDEDKKSQVRICTIGLSGDRVNQFKTELLRVLALFEWVVSRGGLQKSEIISDFRSLFWLFCVYRGSQVNLHKNGTSALELCPKMSKRYLRWIILVL